MRTAYSAGALAVVPRFIRLGDAPRFFGMDKNRFNREVRLHLTEIRIGRQGRAFDRLEMESAADDYESRNGRPAANPQRRQPWDNSNQALPSVVGSGTSTSALEECEFARALERVISPRRRHSSRSASTTCGKRASTAFGKITAFEQRQPSTSWRTSTREASETTRCTCGRSIPSSGAALKQVHMGSLQAFIAKRRTDGVKTKTINSALAIVRRILKLASGE